MTSKIAHKKNGVGAKSNFNSSTLTNKHWQNSNLGKMKKTQDRNKRMQEKHKFEDAFFEIKLKGYDE